MRVMRRAYGSVTKAWITKYMVFESTKIDRWSFLQIRLVYTGSRGNPIPKLSKSPDPPLGQTRKG
jgi:hypothetical protein